MRRAAAVAGIVGPLLFAIVVLTLTIAEYAFLRSLGWDPVSRPTYDWPSGLSLGPLGLIMTVTFVLSGLLMSAFAFGLRAELQDRAGQIATILLVWSGVAMMGLAFSTDPTANLDPIMPVTWHGRLHDLSFMALGLMLIPSMIMFAISFRETHGWKGFSLFTWITAALAIPTFALKGIVFYAFLVVILAWNVAVAIRLYQVT